MSLRINNNIASINGHRNMTKNDMAVSKSLEKLSSGLRINRAADDAAGLIISEQMRAQLAGLDQATANSEQAVSMVQTAEGALDEMNSMLKKARQLAIHAANAGVNDTNQLAADQSELDNIVGSITRIAQNTQFGTKKILDGTLRATSTYTAATLAQGYNAANFDVAPTIAASGDRLTAGTYSVNVTTAYAAGTAAQATATSTLSGANNAFDAQAEVDVTAEVTNITGNIVYGAGAGASASSGALVAGSTLSSGKNYTLTITNGTTTYTSGALAGAGNGTTLVSDLVTQFNAANAGTATVTWTGAGAPAITFGGSGPQGANGNGYYVTLTDGVTTASASTDPTTTGVAALADPLVADSGLSAATVLNSGDSYTLDIVDSGGTVVGGFTTSATGNNAGTTLFGTMVTALDTAANGQFDVSLAGGNITLTAVSGGLYDSGAGNSYRVRLRNTTDSDVALGALTTGGQTTGAANTVAELRDGSGNKVADLTVAANQTDGTIVSNSKYGITVDLKAAAAGSLGDKGAILVASDLNDGAEFQIGANRDQTTTVSIASMKSTDLGKSATNVTDANATLDSLRTGAYFTNGLAQEAISVIDKAIDDVTNQRGTLGSVQANTLEVTINSLRVTTENVTAAESTIRDVDYAKESAAFTRNNILIQASTAMLAQANQLPQNVLKLLG